MIEEIFVALVLLMAIFRYLFGSPFEKNERND